MTGWLSSQGEENEKSSFKYFNNARISNSCNDCYDTWIKVSARQN